VLAQPVDAEVRKIDKPQAKLTLSHGEIKNLQMPAMTMVWRVRDPAMLDKLNVGDKVRFQGEKLNGQFTVVQIEVAR
jgi:Cu/Ag efflux protein CusF